MSLPLPESGPWYGRYVDEDTKAKKGRPDGRTKSPCIIEWGFNDKHRADRRSLSVLPKTLLKQQRKQCIRVYLSTIKVKK